MDGTCSLTTPLLIDLFIYLFDLFLDHPALLMMQNETTTMT